MYKFLLCLRYLRTRYIALASVTSVMLGVATMIVVNSVMAGFSTEMKDRIHGILADVVIETRSLDGQPNAEEQFAVVEETVGEYVEAMTATVEIYGMLSFQFGQQWTTQHVTLIGIVPHEKAKLGSLVEYLGSYNPVVEDGRVVRPAFRSRDDSPGWELTSEAMAYRRQIKQLEKAALEHHRRENDEPHNLPPPPFGGAASGEESGGAAASDAPVVDGGRSIAADTHSPHAAAEPGDVANAAGHVRPEPSTSDFAHDPFADVPLESNPGETLDLEAPQEFRLYVGAGLIQFLYEDPETGKFSTVEMVKPGDDVKLTTITAGRPPKPISFPATVVDTFKSGMSEYDTNLIFCNIEALQKARGMVDPDTGARHFTSIQIKLKDFADADEVVDRLKAVLPPQLYTVRTWEQKQAPLLSAVEVEAAILNVLLFLIITVAGFGILAIFYMIVVEKTRDIGILKSLGASSGGVMSIFLSYGLALGVVGSGVGVVLGLLFVRYINVIESWLSLLIGRKVFEEKIYYFPVIPTSVNPMMVVWVALGAMTIAVLASILPARRAARLHPVDALRFQ